MAATVASVSQAEAQAAAPATTCSNSIYAAQGQQQQL